MFGFDAIFGQIFCFELGNYLLDSMIRHFFSFLASPFYHHISTLCLSKSVCCHCTEFGALFTSRLFRCKKEKNGRFGHWVRCYRSRHGTWVITSGWGLRSHRQKRLTRFFQVYHFSILFYFSLKNSVQLIETTTMAQIMHHLLWGKSSRRVFRIKLTWKSANLRLRIASQSI